MRIAFLVTRMDSIGGAQIHVRDISLWLKQNGHDPLVMTGARGPICETLFAAGIEVVEVRGLVRPIHLLKDIRALVGNGRALKEWGPDLLSCHSSKAGILPSAIPGRKHRGRPGGLERMTTHRRTRSGR